MHVVLVNYAYAKHLTDADQLLDAYGTLTGWAEAIATTGASVRVVQAFSRDLSVRRNGIEYRFSGIGAERNGGASRWRQPRALTRAVVQPVPDVVHVNSLDFALEAWLLRRALPSTTALVVQDHASGIPRAISLKATVRRRLMRAPDAFLFTADAQSTPWRTDRFIASPQRVYEVLESSTMLRPMDRASARAVSGVEGSPAVLWVGRLNTNKDPLTVLDGFEQALERMPGAVLTMVYGEDDLLPAIRERLRRSARLAASVRLAGQVPHERLAAFYSAADLFVSGSMREGSGYAAIEACACGLVPVVTDIPPFRVVTGGGAIGALWPCGDAPALTRTLVDVAGRDLVRERAGVADHFARSLSWPCVGRRAVAIYEDVRSYRRTRAHAR